MKLLLFLIWSGFVAASSAVEEDTYEYYDSYYSSGDSYSEYGEDSNSSENAQQFPDYDDSKFRVTCSQDHVIMYVSRQIIPQGLKLHVPNKRDQLGQKCVSLVQNTTSLTYTVVRSCSNVISTELIGSNVFYRHEALLIRKGSTVTSSSPYSTLYTIVMECEQFGFNSGNGKVLFPPNNPLRAEARIFEHRFAGGTAHSCKRPNCPYGDLCLPGSQVDGYLCICSPGQTCPMKCPPDYYGCDRSNNSNSHSPTKLQCISNGWLCDRRLDCKLKDDEASCTEVWSDWSAWSKCSVECGGGIQTRDRRCDIAFIRDPERCKLYRNALGCSRRCLNNDQTETENRTCGDVTCASVTCDRRHMTVVIPREPGMTSQAIHERMLIGGDPRCKPSYNDTHVIFVTFLHKCNTTSTVDKDIVTYRNEILYKSETDASSIIMRDLGHSYSVTCRFKRRRKVVLRKRPSGSRSNTEVAVLSYNHGNESEWAEMNRNEMTEHYASGDGDFEFKMDLYKASDYQESYRRSDYPLHKRLHEKLHVAIHFQTVDEDLTIMIDRCQATPTRSRDQSKYAYVFIENGCAVDNTVNLYSADIGPQTACFSIESFKFVDETKPFVFFQCDVIVCDVADVDCRPNCSETRAQGSRKKRDAMFPVDEELIRGHVVQGPIIIEEDIDVSGRPTEGKIVHRRISPIKDVVPDQRSPTENETSSTTYMVVALVGGITCLCIGIAAGSIISRRFRKRPTYV